MLHDIVAFVFFKVVDSGCTDETRDALLGRLLIYSILELGCFIDCFHDNCMIW